MDNLHDYCKKIARDIPTADQENLSDYSCLSSLHLKMIGDRQTFRSLLGCLPTELRNWDDSLLISLTFVGVFFSLSVSMEMSLIKHLILVPWASLWEPTCVTTSGNETGLFT